MMLTDRTEADMIVKVVDVAPDALVKSAHYDVGDHSIASGVWWSSDPPEKRDYKAIHDYRYLFAHGIEGAPLVEDVHGGFQQWKVKFAYWYSDNDVHPGHYLVVTSGDIFLMSDHGKTIDRV